MLGPGPMLGGTTTGGGRTVHCCSLGDEKKISANADADADADVWPAHPEAEELAVAYASAVMCTHKVLNVSTTELDLYV
jgi:hypothetical protein